MTDDDGDEEMSADEMRYAVIRKIYTVMGFHRRCPEAACRRARRCAGCTMRCGDDNPGPVFTEEQCAEALAQVKRLLEARVEENEAARAAAEHAAARSAGAESGAKPRGAARPAPYPCKASPARTASRRRGTRS